MNRRIAQMLRETAELLQAADANPFRVDAYRRAAESLEREPRPAREFLAEGGLTALEQALGVGERMASTICQIVTDGYLPLLDRLRRSAQPNSLLESVPGVGRVWADRLHAEWGITTLEDLEAAAYDGRLEHAVGMGPKRINGIRDSLAARLGRLRPPAVVPSGPDVPALDELLDVDREYRDAAEAGKLRLIAPRRFNPTHEAWLPILHTTRGKRRYTALFSNTARAHAYDKRHEWVVIYEEDPHGTRPWTVITSHRGPTAGRRVVRGREAELDGARAA